MVHPDNTLVELPIVLRDLVAENRLHERQPYYEVIEDAVLWWLECGGWSPAWQRYTDVAPPAARRRRGRQAKRGICRAVGLTQEAFAALERVRRPGESVSLAVIRLAGVVRPAPAASPVESTSGGSASADAEPAGSESAEAGSTGTESAAAESGQTAAVVTDVPVAV